MLTLPSPPPPLVESLSMWLIPVFFVLFVVVGIGGYSYWAQDRVRCFPNLAYLLIQTHLQRE